MFAVPSFLSVYNTQWYDPEEDCWTDSGELFDLPYKRLRYCAATVRTEQRIFVFGGQTVDEISDEVYAIKDTVNWYQVRIMYVPWYVVTFVWFSGFCVQGRLCFSYRRIQYVGVALRCCLQIVVCLVVSLLDIYCDVESARKLGVC